MLQTDVLPRPSLLTQRPRYRPDIEGLRAVAVLIVIAFHAGVPGFSGGYVGVDVFFVLSGYLITWLLVDEAERTGTVSLRTFYARRARRLLPAMAVVLFVTLGITAALYAPFEQQMLAKTWVATALYASNIHFANEALDYHGGRAETDPLLHSWSLSVEEQFYFVWPVLVLFGLGVLSWQRGRSSPSPRRLVVWLSVASAVSFAYSLYLTRTSESTAFFLSPARAWEFGVGGLAVLLPLGRWPRRFLNPVRSGLVGQMLGWVGLFGLGLSTVLYDKLTPFPGTAALLPVLSTVLVLRAGTAAPTESGTRLYRLLSLRPLQAVGKLSYSWYLWHWPALVFAAALFEPFPLGGRMVAVAASLGIAYLSYRFVENPLRHSPALASPWRSFAMVSTVSAVTVAAAGMWWMTARTVASSEFHTHLREVSLLNPAVYDDPECDRFKDNSEVTGCVFGDSTSTRTVVLLGDSHAVHFFPALVEAAEEDGWRLITLTKGACPYVDTPPGGAFIQCEEWKPKVIEYIADLAPDLTIVGSASHYHQHAEVWESGTRTALKRLQSVSGSVALILDPPPAGFDVPACLARASWRWQALAPDCTPREDPEAELLVAAQARAARSVPGVMLVDVRDRVCKIGECGPVTEDGLVRYRDQDHLSVEFAKTFANTFSALLSSAEAPPRGAQETDLWSAVR